MIPKHDNGTLIAGNFGTRKVGVVSISHGMTVVADEDSTRDARVMYTSKRTSGSFGMVLVFTSYMEHVRTMQWFEEYVRRAAHPDVNPGPMRVIVPVRKFDKVGIPAVSSGPLVTDDEVGRVVWRVNVGFEGARDSLNFSDARVSKFSMPAWKDAASQYFYPGGIQLGGTEKGEDALYNNLPGGAPLLPGGRSNSPEADDWLIEQRAMRRVKL